MASLGVTYDLFRCNALGLPSVAENAHWISALLRVAARESFTEIRPIFAKSDGGTVDVGALAQSLDLPNSPDSWAKLVSDPAYDAEIELHLAPHFDRVTHLFGFGLTPTLMRFLDTRGVAFVDIELASLRFSPKINFRARTNRIDFLPFLDAIAYPAENHFNEAMRAMSQRSRQCIPRGTRRGLFLGQSQLDLSIIENGKIRRPFDSDLVQKIRKHSEDLDELHVLTHPGAATRLGHLLPLLDLVPNAVLGASGAYSMFLHSDTVRAISLSSGTLREAAFLGIEAVPLMLPDRDNSQVLPECLSDWTEVTDDLFSLSSIKAFASSQPPSSALILRQGPSELVEAALGRNINTLASAPDIVDLPTLQAGVSYEISERSGFGDIRQFGWSHLEDWGVWSDGQAAALAFRMDADSKTILRLNGKVFRVKSNAYDHSPDVQVKLRIDGKEYPVSTSFSKDSWQANAELPASLKHCVVCIHFFITGACSPRTFSISEDVRKLGIGLQSLELVQRVSAPKLDVQTQDAAYYCKAHHSIAGYRENNWMTPFARPLRAVGLNSIVECAVGNGEFAELMAPHVKTYWALDWASSHLVPYSTPNVRYMHWDAYKDEVPSADLACSADFLEHIREEDLDRVLKKILEAALRQFHVIACYDDFHSHLTVQDPDWWFKRVKAVSEVGKLDAEKWRILPWAHRDPDRPVVILSNFDLG